MRRRVGCWLAAVGGWFFFLLSFVYVALPSAYQGVCLCDDSPSQEAGREMSHDRGNTGHRLAILVPFRERFEELLEFAPHLHQFLSKQGRRHHIFVINQVDNLRFNRASLLNVGFLETPARFDHVALHDVDLLPLSPHLSYNYPEEGPYHLAAPHLHPRYHYPTFIGGILLLRREHYGKVNGLSNKYWGWGLEDDELYARIREANLSITRPGNLTSGNANAFRHIHNRRLHGRDMIKCYNQQVITRRRDRETGLSTTRYYLQSKQELTIDGAGVTVLNVILECDRKLTPWCDCTSNIGNTPRAKSKAQQTSDVIAPRIDRKKHLSPDG